MQVREFADGCDVTQALLVRESEVRVRRDGAEYLKLTLGDRTGSVPAMVWDGVGEARELCLPGAVVFVGGRYSIHARFGPQLAVQSLRAELQLVHVRKLERHDQACRHAGECSV